MVGPTMPKKQRETLGKKTVVGNSTSPSGTTDNLQCKLRLEFLLSKDYFSACCPFKAKSTMVWGNLGLFGTGCWKQVFTLGYRPHPEPLWHARSRYLGSLQWAWTRECGGVFLSSGSQCDPEVSWDKLPQLGRKGTIVGMHPSSRAHS